MTDLKHILSKLTYDELSTISDILRRDTKYNTIDLTRPSKHTSRYHVVAFNSECPTDDMIGSGNSKKLAMLNIVIRILQALKYGELTTTIEDKT